MHRQTQMTALIRTLLVDWMVEVQETFELNHETLYLAVKIVDIYLGKVDMPKNNLQLLGAAAMFIACKFDVSVAVTASHPREIYHKLASIFTLSGTNSSGYRRYHVHM